jgi:hypothetical protein
MGVLEIIIKVRPPPVDNVSVIRRSTLNGLLGIAALLVPLTAATDSGLQTDARTGPMRATAHVNFKIIIPTVLGLELRQGIAGEPGAQTVSVVSNGRNVTLNAAVRTQGSGVLSRGNVIISAAARRGIAEDAQCTAGAGGRAVVCTVSMP